MIKEKMRKLERCIPLISRQAESAEAFGQHQALWPVFQKTDQADCAYPMKVVRSLLLFKQLY